MRDSSQSWQKILSQGFSKVDELLRFLNLPSEIGSGLAEKEFKTRVPHGYATRMESGNRYDPLLLQVLAVGEELDVQPGFVRDPLEERVANPVQGLIHKYHGRVLLTLTGVCAINCRYCFRRHFPYSENNPGRHGWSAALDYIAKDVSIHEVILSGGDPLLASNETLSALFSELSLISHVTTVRIHTRIPVVLPERMEEDLMTLFKVSRFQIVVVLHVNHQNEINEQVATVCHLLREAGCCLLNQSVLLKGVNDDASVLASLSKKLFTVGVLPYYLHLLDKVQGAMHFDIPMERALLIFEELQSLLPGYLVPRLAREEAFKKNKTLLSP